MAKETSVWCAVLGAGLLLAGGVAHAARSDPPQPGNMKTYTDSTLAIEVASKTGQRYDVVSNANKKTPVEVWSFGRCPDGSPGKNYKRWKEDTETFKILAGGDQVHFHSFGATRDWMRANFGLPYQRTKDPVAACNAEVERRVNGGQPRFVVLRDGFELLLPNYYSIEGRTFCSADREGNTMFHEPRRSVIRGSGYVHAKVRCMASAKAVPPRAPVPDGVRGAKVWVNPSSRASYTGVCPPPPFHLGGELQYYANEKPDRPVKVRYAYETSSGLRSPVYTTSFDRTKSKNLYSWPFEFPMPGKGQFKMGETGNGTPPSNAPMEETITLRVLGPLSKHVSDPSVKIRIQCVAARSKVRSPEPAAPRAVAPRQGVAEPPAAVAPRQRVAKPPAADVPDGPRRLRVRRPTRPGGG